jgi:hypothetical protein
MILGGKEGINFVDSMKRMEKQRDNYGVEWVSIGFIGCLIGWMSEKEWLGLLIVGHTIIIGCLP